MVTPIYSSMRKLSLFFLIICCSLLGWSQDVLYVDLNASGTADGSSWTNAFTSFDSAIAHYSTGDSIFMAAGTYKPPNTGTNSHYALPNGAKIFGGFAGTENSIGQRDINANKSFFDGDIGTNGTASDNARKVLYVTNNTSQIVVDGFTIRNGYAYTIGGSITVGGGGARVSSGKVRFENCEFSDNYTYMRGGALAIYGSSSKVELVNCVFKNNLSKTGTSSGLGGAIFCNAGSLFISACEFTSNTARQGGAIASFQPNIFIDQSIFSGNEAASGRGGAIDNGSESALYIYNSLFVGNYANTTGAAVYTSTTLNTKTIRYAGCTFAHNYNNSGSTNYAVYASDYTSVTNCILWGNRATKQLFNLPPAIEPNIISCLMEDTISNGTSMYYSDPLFVNPGSASSAPFELGSYSYKLSSKSEAVNNGDDDYVYLNYELALGGTDRTIGSATDIGAYESPYISYTIEPLLADSNAGSLSGGGSYLKDSTATLSASPSSSCYSFLYWKESDTVYSSNSSINILVTGDRTFTAYFDQLQDTVELTASPIMGGTTEGSGYYGCSIDSVRSLIAVPSPCYEFVEWTKDGVKISEEDTLMTNVTDNLSLVAHFKYAEYTISAQANVAAGGTVTGGGNYKCDSSTTLSAKRNSCYDFVSWTEGGVVLSTDTFLNLKMSSDRQIVANFKVKSYAINVVVDPVIGGSVTGDGNADCGSTVKLVASRKSNYIFTGWEENGSVFSTNEVYQFTASEDRNLKATFSFTGNSASLEDQPVLAYPNPVKDVVTVESGQVVLKSVSLFDVSGKEVMAKSFEIEGKQAKLNLEDLNPGVYYLKVQLEDRLINIKLFKV